MGILYVTILPAVYAYLCEYVVAPNLTEPLFDVLVTRTGFCFFFVRVLRFLFFIAIFAAPQVQMLSDIGAWRNKLIGSVEC